MTREDEIKARLEAATPHDGDRYWELDEAMKVLVFSAFDDIDWLVAEVERLEGLYYPLRSWADGASIDINDLSAEVKRQTKLLDADRISGIVFQHSDGSERQGRGDSCCACDDIHEAEYPAHIAELIRGGD